MDSFTWKSVKQFMDCHKRAPWPTSSTSTESSFADLVLEVAGMRLAVECKLSTQPDRRDLKRLTALADAIGAEHRILLSRSNEIIESNSGIVCNLPWLLENMGRLIRSAT